ncbi:MAG: SusE domain-containing protein [Bacteroidota bacterium]
MKNILQKILFGGLLLVTAVSSCKKEETKIFFEGGTAPVLTPSNATIPALSVATKDNEALKLTWTNPNYRFTTGVNSQDVSYILQIDKAGTNFASPAKQEVSIAKELSTSMTVLELNGFLTKMELEADKPADIEMRVVSSIKGAVPLNSNVVKFTNVIPYEDFAILPPASNELYIVGSATKGDWSNPVPAGQKLTTVKKGLYEITLPIDGGESYLLLPVNGSWDVKYGAIGANNTNNTDTDAFKIGGGDLKAPAASGDYKLTVDFKTGKFKMTKL